MGQNGRLYIVATPIGNMSDITHRAVDVLKNVDLIISEDTRDTDKLLQRFNINTPQKSYRDQNHEKIFPELIHFLRSGKSIALVSDSGTPLISDPGFKLVQELVKVNIDIVSIPGPTALIAGLTISGLPTDKFAFLGFLPKSKVKRIEIIKKYSDHDCTLTIYESPYRIGRLLRELIEIIGDRAVCVAKELTKVHEKVYRGSISEVTKLLENDKPKGEYIVFIGKEGYKYES